MAFRIIPKLGLELEHLLLVLACRILQKLAGHHPIKRLFKPILIVCVCVVVVCVSVISIVSKKDAAQQKAAEDEERRAIATAMVALDQYAPDVDYDSDLTTANDWIATFNADGTVTVWAPAVYGKITVMLTGSDGEYAPYFVSVDGEELLNLPQ